MPLILIEAPSSASHGGLGAWGQQHPTEETSGDSTTKPHQCYGGINLQARRMYRCVLTQDGEILLHQPMQVGAEPFMTY